MTEFYPDIPSYVCDGMLSRHSVMSDVLLPGHFVVCGGMLLGHYYMCLRVRRNVIRIFVHERVTECYSDIPSFVRRKFTGPFFRVCACV